MPRLEAGHVGGERASSGRDGGEDLGREDGGVPWGVRAEGSSHYGGGSDRCEARWGPMGWVPRDPTGDAVTHVFGRARPRIKAATGRGTPGCEGVACEDVRWGVVGCEGVCCVVGAVTAWGVGSRVEAARADMAT